MALPTIPPAEASGSTRPAGPTLRCTVRGCHQPLTGGLPATGDSPAAAPPPTSMVTCAAGHSFDRARRGYWNLLQPQDRRSKRPGDPPAAVAARGRILARGFAAALLTAMDEVIATSDPGEQAAVLDVGCGDGFFLDALCSGSDWRRCGVDLSRPAIETACRRRPSACWVVANVDHGLPWMDASFDLALSINARLPASELARVLRRDGRLIVATPAPDDLRELRELALGAAAPLTTASHRDQQLGTHFELIGGREVRAVVTFDRAAIGDALESTYRGARRARMERIEQADQLQVTLAWQLAWYRHAAPAVG